MKRQLTDKVRVSHVLDAINEIERYLIGVSYQEFIANSEKRFATLKQLEIVCEACNKMSRSLKEDHPDIKWKEINGFRNISTHEYFAVDTIIVWEVAQNDLPTLKRQFTEIIARL